MCLYFYRHIQTYAHTYLIICASPNPWHQSDKSVDFFIPFKPPIHDFPLPHALLLRALGVPLPGVPPTPPPPPPPWVLSIYSSVSIHTSLSQACCLWPLYRLRLLILFFHTTQEHGRLGKGSYFYVWFFLSMSVFLVWLNALSSTGTASALLARLPPVSREVPGR